MKKLKQSILFCAIAVAMLGAVFCGKTEVHAAISEIDEIYPMLEPESSKTDRLLKSTEQKAYWMTMAQSGTLTIVVEGDLTKLTETLTDWNGKSWKPLRVEETDGTRAEYVYEMRVGSYVYKLGVNENAEIPEDGVGYTVTYYVRWADEKYQINTTKKDAQQILKKKHGRDRDYSQYFKGHVAQNAPADYYKFTLKKMSYCTFSLNTQIDGVKSNPFVLSLYNEKGRRLVSWENPDWTYTYGDLFWIYDEYGWPVGMVEMLPAGTYYLKIAAKTEDNGVKLTNVRYGKYEFFASAEPTNVVLKLSPDKAVYTGKNIPFPKVTVKNRTENDKYNCIYSDETYTRVKNIRKVGKYRIATESYNFIYNDPVDSFAYATFTVTPTRGRISSIQKTGKGQLQVSVKKNRQSTGYQIQIAGDKKFRKSRRNVYTTETTETISHLRSGKTYYIRVRNYKDFVTKYNSGSSDPEKIYGPWSKIKEIRLK